MNPAVTLGALIAGTIGEFMAGLYAVVQILGSVMGAMFVRVSSPGAQGQGGVRKSVSV